ncbi:imidazolonepropionase [Rhizocola hellebori]|uniref:Imidazolonepropionase n=1 Tax=Rhizocola hellebori TaxID=1392758 RepID=A0A8J3QAN3_9ACTN|nr:imidazolonepropionase [Rhizocola hellebori]GIH07036.1 imidazolonepropionase [Rhizocola hellebori]
MRTLLITNIGELTTFSDDIGDAIIVSDRVEWVGSSANAPAADERLDAGGAAVMPGFVDSHSHLIFAGDRAHEFAARMAGEPYTGGGIRTTVAATRAASDEELARNASRLVAEAMRQGTTTIEIKSGYGLDVENEARSLRIASTLTTETTYLGAHIKPSPDVDYVGLVTGAMLEACAPHAKWIDVFCERGAFDVDESRAILTAGMAKGLQPRIHANQLTMSKAVQLAVELDCASADHCTHLADEDVDALASSHTVATLLPGCEFSTRAPYPDARRLIDAGATVALATDCNPGSSFTSSMPFCIAVAVRDMRMTPAEALWSATMGGAKALRRNDIGHLGVGAQADLVILGAPSSLHLAYRPGVPLVKKVLRIGVPQ